MTFVILSLIALAVLGVVALCYKQARSAFHTASHEADAEEDTCACGHCPLPRQPAAEAEVPADDPGEPPPSESTPD